jgi:hypothetical protein
MLVVSSKQSFKRPPATARMSAYFVLPSSCGEVMTPDILFTSRRLLEGAWSWLVSSSVVWCVLKRLPVPCRSAEASSLHAVAEILKEKDWSSAEGVNWTWRGLWKNEEWMWGQLQKISELKPKTFKMMFFAHVTSRQRMSTMFQYV